MPTRAQAQAVAARLERAAERQGRAAPVIMGMGKVLIGECASVACLAGHYLLETRIEQHAPLATRLGDSGATLVVDPHTGKDLEWREGAAQLARDLGFRTPGALTAYYARHPEVWGNAHGDQMLRACHAYTRDEPYLTLEQACRHWRGVAARTPEDGRSPTRTEPGKPPPP